MDQNANSAQQLYEQAEQQREQGAYARARALYEQALALYEHAAGQTHSDTARCLHGLALALRDASAYDAAQQRAERALAIRQRTLGPTHPDSAASLHLLGEIRADRGEMQAGIALVEQALTLRRDALGEAHPESIESLMMLALLLAHQGARQRALPMLLQALALCETNLGEDHLLTARVLNGLGVLWSAEPERRPEARSMYGRSLAIYERLRGPEHQDTARSLNNLAAVLMDLGEVEAAQPLVERSLELHERLLGPEHLGTALVLINLGDVHSRQHDYRAARPLYERALVICEQNFGAFHPQTLRSLRKVLSVLGNLQQQEGEERFMIAAMPLHACLMSLEAAAGTLPEADRQWHGVHLDPARAAEELHRWVAYLEADLAKPAPSPAEQETLARARTLRQQAQTAHEQGNYEVAQSLFEEALALQEQVLGESHLDHVDLLRDLARARQAGGQPSAVLPLLQRALDIQLQALGPHHPMSVKALSELMGQHAYEYGPAATLPLQAHIVQLMEEAYGADDPMVRVARESAEALRAMMGEKELADLPRISRSERREQALTASLPAEREVLLTGLDDIDWHSLHHAYGPADDVPDLLRMLLSDDEAVREDAWESLYSNVWHQGTVYEATAHVVPFLLRMLQAGGPPGRLELLYFLASIAEGNSYLEAHATGEWEQEWRDILAKDGKTLEPEREKELTWVAAANRAVGNGIPLYLELLEDEDDEVREQVLIVLSTLRSSAEQVVPALLELLEYELGEEMEVQLARTLRALMDDSSESQAFFADLLARDENEELSFLAALALAERAREQTPEATVPLILNTLRKLGVQHHDEWNEEGANIEDAIRVLSTLGQARALPALLQAFSLLQTPHDALEAAEYILDLLFNEGQVQSKSTAIRWEGKRQHIEYWEPKPQPPRTASSLTEQERAALRVLLAHDPLWIHAHNLLALYGLPAEREALGTLLGS